MALKFPKEEKVNFEDSMQMAKQLLLSIYGIDWDRLPVGAKHHLVNIVLFLSREVHTEKPK